MALQASHLHTDTVLLTDTSICVVLLEQTHDVAVCLTPANRSRLPGLWSFIKTHMCMRDTGSVAMWELRQQPAELNLQFSHGTRAVLSAHMSVWACKVSAGSKQGAFLLSAFTVNLTVKFACKASLSSRRMACELTQL